MMKFSFLVPVVLIFFSGCARLENIGQEPEFTPTRTSGEHRAMMIAGLPKVVPPDRRNMKASLWTRDDSSLLGDRRAADRGDILTVVVEIDDSAEISNSSERGRSSSNNMQVPELFGVPQRMDKKLPNDASLGSAVSTNAQSNSSGDGSVRRNEKLTLKIAATVVEVLPNGVLAIQGSQEVRVNFELRELLVTGYVRPADISRQNEITYDKIASARISYGGRGQITDVQQPRYGQQVLDVILPF